MIENHVNKQMVVIAVTYTERIDGNHKAIPNKFQNQETELEWEN